MYIKYRYLFYHISIKIYIAIYHKALCYSDGLWYNMHLFEINDGISTKKHMFVTNALPVQYCPLTH